MAEIATPCLSQSARVSSAIVWVKSERSMWQTPPYLRSGPPGGQHMTSTQSNPSPAANVRTSSNGNSPNIAVTKPNCMSAVPYTWGKWSMVATTIVYTAVGLRE